MDPMKSRRLSMRRTGYIMRVEESPSLPIPALISMSASA
jgi:hypothetical protein